MIINKFIKKVQKMGQNFGQKYFLVWAFCKNGKNTHTETRLFFCSKIDQKWKSRKKRGWYIMGVSGVRGIYGNNNDGTMIQ